jgi:hypothetical protein
MGNPQDILRTQNEITPEINKRVLYRLRRYEPDAGAGRSDTEAAARTESNLPAGAGTIYIER